jgi:hypothetical protein
MAFANQLKLDRDPFVRDGASPLGPVSAAFQQLMRHVEQKTAIVVVAGPAGSGKTFLLDMTEEACRGRGISVLRIERGDLAHTVIGKCADLLLVDEADFVDEATLNFLAGHPQTPKTVVFACRAPRGVGDVAVPTLVELTPLTPNEARDFVVERATKAGRADLFTPEALESLIAGTSGLPRLLRSVGKFALFYAAYEGASQVGAEHVAEALAAQTTRSQLPLTVKHDMDLDDASVSPPFQSAPVAEEPEISHEAAHLVPVPFQCEEGNFPKALLPVLASSSKTESRRKSFVKAKIFAVVVLPLLVLNGSLGEAGQYATLWNTKVRVPPRLMGADAMRELERVAKAEYPGHVILAVITTPALQPLQIAAPVRMSGDDKGQVASTRKVQAPRAKMVSGAQIGSGARPKTGKKTAQR